MNLDPKEADRLGIPKFKSTNAVEMVENELIPYLKKYLQEKGEPQRPFVLFQHPRGDSWARMPCLKEWMDDRSRMFRAFQDLTNIVPVPAVVFYSDAWTLIPNEHRMKDMTDAMNKEPGLGVEEMERRGFGKKQDLFMIRGESNKGEGWQWAIQYSLDPIRFFNEKRPKDFDEMTFTGRAHFYRQTREADKGLPKDL